MELRKQEHSEIDAAERRVTDLYTKAVEQVGHAEAAVRLGGLYALERVAQNTPSQRQTIVNVLCAYLRMPYVPPVKPQPAATRDPHQELQVRLTAQRILVAHLSRPDDIDHDDVRTFAPDSSKPYWPGLDLDLTGATLIDWDLTRGDVNTAKFTDVTFTGEASFADATFAETAWFEGSSFGGPASFSRASFLGIARFHAATFTGHARFTGRRSPAGRDPTATRSSSAPGSWTTPSSRKSRSTGRADSTRRSSEAIPHSKTRGSTTSRPSRAQRSNSAKSRTTSGRSRGASPSRTAPEDWCVSR
jgi:hypothetical protein